MMNYKQIARRMSADNGVELTPDEVKQTIQSIAAKFRAVDPNLPKDDDELIIQILGL